MTIEFNCPKCDSVIGFADKHAGKRAHCATCGQQFVIPQKSYAKATKIIAPKEPKGEPVSGFFRAVLIDNWKMFFNSKNLTGIAFIVTATIFKFYTANRNFTISIQGRANVINIFVPFGWTCSAIAWGFLFWYYREIIYSTGFDEEDFPKVTLGGFYSFAWKIFSSVYTLFLVFLVAGLPAFVAYYILKKTDSQMPVLLNSLFLLGIFLLPAAIMNVAVGKDLTLLRPDYLIREAFSDFIPYFVVFVFLAAAIYMQTFLKQYNPKQPSGSGIQLILNCAVQMVFLYAMRATGLFYRHYSCHSPW